MVRFKKVVAVMLSTILCAVAIGSNVNAETVDSIVKSTPGGTEGSVNIRLVATKEAFTASTSGYNGYEYGVKASLFPTMCIADSWKVTAEFNTRTDSLKKLGTIDDSNSCYVFSSIPATSEQYISGNFAGKLLSTEYGSTAIVLNVAY